MKRTIVIFSLIALSVSIFLRNPDQIYAQNNSNSIYEFTLTPGEIKLGEISYKNNSPSKSTFLISTFSYDSKKSEILQIQPLLSVSKKEYIIESTEDFNIQYALSIPKNQPQGTYFNIVLIETKNPAKNEEESKFNIEKGFGTLFVINVVNTDTNLEEIFFKKSNTELKIEKTGFPLIQPLKVKYTYINQSNFVFKPQGEVRIIDIEGKQVTERFSINPKREAVYPNEKIVIEKDFSIWNNIKNILGKRDIIAQTYSNTGKEFLTNKATVNIKTPVVISIGIATILSLILFLFGGKFLLKRIFKQD